MSIAARAIHGVNVCLIPHPDNDDRPLLLRPRSLRVVAVLLLTAKVMAVGLLALTPAEAQLSTITTNRIVQLTNAERSKNGLSPLTVNAKLTAAAKDKAAHMLSEDYFAHISPSGVTPWFWMSRHGYEYQVAGENLAIDFVEAENVVAAWMASPSHRDNILQGRYTETGVAVATGEFQGATSTVVVHMFGLPLEAEVDSQSQRVTEPTPTPSTSPTATPTPSLAPTTAPSQPLPPAPPRAPRISLVGSTDVVASEAIVHIEGEPDSTISVSINGTVAGTFELGSSGEQEARLTVSDYADGELKIAAVALKSDLQSEAASLVITKDSSGPSLVGATPEILLAPLFDRGQALVRMPEVSEEVSWLLNETSVIGGERLVSVERPLSLVGKDAVGNATALHDLLLQPQFETNTGNTSSQTPDMFVRYSGGFVAIVLTVLTGLLLLAILVRIRIQRPELLAHTMSVIALAGVLWWW